MRVTSDLYSPVLISDNICNVLGILVVMDALCDRVDVVCIRKCATFADQIHGHCRINGEDFHSCQSRHIFSDE